MVVCLSLAGHTSVVSAASYSEQASVASWPLRIGLTLGVLLLVLLVLAGYRRGWRRRRESQSESGLGVCPTRSGKSLREPSSVHESFRVKYIGTAKSDDHFTRIIAGGGPARAQMLVSGSGIEIDRQGESPIHIAAGSIVNAGSGNGLLQKAYSRHGLLMITWRWNDQEVTSGFWLAERDEHIRALGAIEDVTAVPQATGVAEGSGTTQGGQE